MKAYDSYKDSGIQWLPKIPSHWDSSKIKSHFRLRSTKVSDQDFPALSVSKNGVTPQLETAVKTDNGDNRKLVKAGDFVVNSRSDRKGSCGVSSLDGSVSLINIVLEPIDGYAQYYHHLFRSNDYIEEFYRNGRGIVSDLWTTRWNEMSSIMIPFPPIEEQKKIVAFLDKQITLIESCKCQRERELQTLNELKQAEIASVVTRGLNPNVPMAYMDTPLRTMHPAHWKRVRNMTFLVDQSEKVGKRSDDYQLLSLTTNGVIVRDVESGKGKFPKDFETYKVVEPGELVFCLFDIDETPRTVGLSNNYGMITGAYDVFKVKDSIVNPSYVYAFYLVVDNIKALRPYYSGLRKVVKHNRFMQIGFPLPPIEEQNAIVDYIRSKTCKIDSMIEALKQEIERLTEYKQRLISDVVTGQIDVRNEEIA